MEHLTLFALVGAGVAFVVGIGVFNSLIGRKNAVENSFSTIDVMLKKRSDLIPGLVATVKQYATHEQETLTNLTSLRARAGEARRGSDESVALNNEITSALGRVMVVAESYPVLRASENFQQLQRSLNEIEEQLSAARRAFNAAVTSYNDGVEMFPTSVVARLMGLRRRQVFELPEAERARPDVAALFKV
jgi:LemA protein